MQVAGMSNGLQALLVVGGSALLGALYVTYISAEPFPPAIALGIPAVWLAGALAGCVGAVRALRRDRNRLAAVAALVLDIPSIAFAVLFTMGALVGD